MNKKIVWFEHRAKIHQKHIMQGEFNPLAIFRRILNSSSQLLLMFLRKPSADRAKRKVSLDPYKPNYLKMTQ